ncbi:hypothetical protein ACFWFS_01325 [Streptomyces albidoflavus]
MVKLVPLIFQGLGAHHRRLQYGLMDQPDLSSLSPSSWHTLNELHSRISCTVDLPLLPGKELK